jgi:threonine dehydrogenase-like Zn-dependent dehydrogenase
MADVGALKIPDGLPDEKVLFLTDIFPTGYMAAEQCNIQPGDTVAVWGCGPVGQFAIRSAKLLGAEQVVAIDDRGRVPERLKMAEAGGAITIDMRDEYVYDKLLSLTGGRGPDACIDAVGMEAHGFTPDAFIDKVKAAVMLATDRPHALRQAINCCRKGGTVSVPGVYGGFLDKVPFGAAMQKGLAFRMGQTHVHKYVPILTKLIEEGKIDPSFVITHKLPLNQAPHGYQIFRDKQDGCIKIVLKPAA